MKGKRDQYRFTIRMNPEDPSQAEAAKLLNEKGRYISAFVAEAVISFQKVNVSVQPFMARDEVVKYIESALDQRLGTTAGNLEQHKQIKYGNEQGKQKEADKQNVASMNAMLDGMGNL
jgi:hypothetical protein